MKILHRAVLAGALLAFAAPVLAHSPSDHNMAGMMGMHDMAATVTAVNKTTGAVSVNAGGMSLHVHFPPASLANVNVGDKITVHLGFTKP
jgi:hypothetical protein